MWQDTIFTIGNVVFAITLLPMVWKNQELKRCDTPYTTSIPTSIVLYFYSVAFYTLGMWSSSVSAWIVALTWTFIAMQKFYFERKEATER